MKGENSESDFQVGENAKEAETPKVISFDTQSEDGIEIFV